MGLTKDLYDVTSDLIDRVGILGKETDLEKVKNEYQRMLFEIIEINRNLLQENFELKQSKRLLTKEELKQFGIDDDKIYNIITILEIDVRNIMRKEMENNLTKIFKKQLGSSK